MSGGASHVFSFGEFIAHYLLAWSPALWERRDTPSSPPRGTPGPVARRLHPGATSDAGGLVPAVDVQRRGRADAHRRLRDAEEHAGRSEEEVGRRGSLLEGQVRPGPGRAGARAGGRGSSTSAANWLASKFWSTRPLRVVDTRRFRAGLPRVRRALANVPTYMIGDDHEITDDWYFSRQWRERVFTRTLGVDIIRNGLIAYTVMQAWGNDPRRWSQGPEANLLQADQRVHGAAARRAAHVVGQTAPRAARTAAPRAAAGQSAAADADVPAARRVLLPGRRSLSSRAGRGRAHEAAVPAPHVAGRRHRLRGRQRAAAGRRASDGPARRAELRTVRRLADGRGAAAAADRPTPRSRWWSWPCPRWVPRAWSWRWSRCSASRAC